MAAELVRSVVQFYDRFVHYAMAGLLGTAAHWTMFSLLIRFRENMVVQASGIGFVCGAAVNYFLNYYLTFHSGRNHLQSAGRFFLVALLLFGVNAGLMYLFAAVMLIQPFAGQVLSSAVVLPVGYMLNKHLTF